LCECFELTGVDHNNFDIKRKWIRGGNIE